MLTYSNCKKVIANGNYGVKEEMMVILDVFLLNKRITETQYNELVTLLHTKEEERSN